MTRFGLRLPLILMFAILATVLTGVAVLVGRNIPSMRVAVQMVDVAEDRLDYGLVDFNRGALVRRSIALPGYAGARFDADPPTVLQVVRGEGVEDWTLSTLDTATGTLTTAARITTHPSVRLDVDQFVHHPNGSWSVHDLVTSTLYYASSDNPDSRVLLTVPPTFMAWSHDSTRVAVDTAGTTTITTVEGGEIVTFVHESSDQMNMRWSEDDRYIMLAKSVFSENTLLVADTRTGDVVAQYFGLAPSWCGSRLLYVADTGDGIFEARMADPAAGTEEAVLARDMSAYLQDGRSLAVSGMDRGSCDWLLVAAGEKRLEVMHLPTGTFITLGNTMDFLRSMRFADDGIMYLIATPLKTELRRIRFDPAVQRYEVLAAVERMNMSLTWIDDAHGGIYMLVDKLMRIDAESGAQAALTGPVVRSFYVMH